MMITRLVAVLCQPLRDRRDKLVLLNIAKAKPNPTNKNVDGSGAFATENAMS